MPVGNLKTAFVTQTDDTATTDVEGVGTIRWDGNNAYKWVQFLAGTGSVDIAVGDVVFYSDYSANQVTGDLTDIEANLGAGVALAAVDVSEDLPLYGWVQIKGQYGPLNTDVVAGAAGNALTTVGTNDLTLDVSAAVTDPIFATLIDATGSAQIILCDFPF